MNPLQILQFPHPDAPAAGTSVEVAPGLRWLRMPLPFVLDHINLWLLEDGPGWTIVDCGIASGTTRRLWEQIFATPIAGKAHRPFQVARVLATHFHPDHVGLAHWLCQRFGVDLWMSQTEYLTAHALRESVAGYARDNLLAMYRRNGLSSENLEKLALRENGYRRGVPEFPQSYRRLTDGDELEIGGRLWRVIMGYGHSPEHAALYCDKLRVLISGDMVLPKISTNISVSSIEPDGNPLQQFLDSLKRYAALPADTLVLPSHGMPFRGVRERAEQLDEHHRLHFAALEEVCVRPLSASEAMFTLFPRALDAHQMFFAMGEAMAHLNCLLYRGLLRRETGADGVIRYVRQSTTR